MDYDKDLREMIQKYNDNNEDLGMLDIHVGNNVIEETFPKVMNFGKTVLFCTGRSAMKRLGIYKKYLDLFKKNKIKVVDVRYVAHFFTHYLMVLYDEKLNLLKLTNRISVILWRRYIHTL